MSFFRYPGGKSKIYKNILCRIKEFKYDINEYREPFFGGGSVGLKLIRELGIKKTWINDKDVGVSCLWTSVIKYPHLIIDHIKKYEPTVNDFFDIKKELIAIKKQPIDVENLVLIGFKKLVIHQISYSGLGVMSGGPLGGKLQKSQYKIDCRWSPDYICKKVLNINKMFENVNVYNNLCTNFDFETVLLDGSESFTYLDPPYFMNGNNLYNCGFSYEDHKRLSCILNSMKYPWLLSYDDCEEIRELYSWAKINYIDVKYTINSSKKTSKSELLISNFGD